jgi:hypothetical protein
MAKCAACGTTILFGGVQDSGMRFCNAKCHSRGSLLLIARQIPPDVLQQQTWAVHHGACPQCQGPGPVDVHKSYRIWSLVILTQWSNTPRISCKRCGVKAQLGDALFSLALGWWGFPWGLVMTPVQIGRNLAGVFRASPVTGPSPDLERAVSMTIAASAARR